MTEQAMTEHAEHTVSLAERRKALLIECAEQRDVFALQLHALKSPLSGSSGRGIRSFLSGKLKVPLMAAGAVAGALLVKRGGPTSLVASALSIWKMAQPVLAMVRRSRDVHPGQ